QTNCNERDERQSGEMPFHNASLVHVSFQMGYLLLHLPMSPKDRLDQSKRARAFAFAVLM
ncbi:MAG TPA: hypothetical protein VFR79_00530, partial [Nitrospira sp.]|nr:hypothetical protein [Nitrospira sp.]